MPYDPRAAVKALPTQADIDLARRLAPVIRFAANEPFLPGKVGITVLDSPGVSPTAPREIAFEPGVSRVIEYAIWWDWDIQHLYELEHVWLKLDENDALVGVDASAHGRLFPMRRPDGSLPIEEGRVTLYSEPGKHAFHAAPEPIREREAQLTASCTSMTSAGRVLVNHMFEDVFDIAPEDHRAVRRHLQSRAFVPSYDFTQAFDLAGSDFVSWPDLHAYIAVRVPQVLAQVKADQPLIRAVLLDSGDTMVDEATEVRDGDDHVIEANLIPGAKEMIETLVKEGYRIALVADGRVKSFANVLGGHGISGHFEAEIISEAQGVEKPAAKMFEAALEALGLTRDDAQQVVMVGNHLGRDVKGANAMGMTSIWLDWAPRRHKVPVDPTEHPDYTITNPSQLPVVLAEIECAMGRVSQNPHIAIARRAAE
ncbi:HAD family hydrolase [Pelagibacterium xiamenense]|uniref:HAD family hydrolase n=1 Tax=Pelagibacterium xiamenense TaxID=2901140 RepID=UPI001E365359|nr:HAD family hydrolase [Pelagibacterium xiamenense]MCD7059794.1 HAD family hydrolase [Pelagibacterium xiamenense]